MRERKPASGGWGERRVRREEARGINQDREGARDGIGIRSWDGRGKAWEGREGRDGRGKAWAGRDGRDGIWKARGGREGSSYGRG